MPIGKKNPNKMGKYSFPDAKLKFVEEVRD
jgi:hypothetical protein